MWLAILLLTVETLSAQPDRFGLPACDAPNHHLATRTAYVICFDETRKVPAWTIYQLTPEMLHSMPAGRQHFHRDLELNSASDADYRNSGFHRSHMVPASDIASSPEAVRETYLLSNAVPQLPELNLSQWRKIENEIRKLAAASDSVIILTGTLFDCDDIRRIGPNQIAVPCATFKAVLSIQGQSQSTYAVILPNQPHAERQTATFEDLELRTGLVLFPKRVR